LFSESADASKDIQIYLNSPGGSVYAGLNLWHDAIHQARCCYNLYGMAAYGAVLCAGAEGKRSALPHSRVMIHQPSEERK
jgi:ATP-dependent Clp protease protease subunit